MDQLKEKPVFCSACGAPLQGGAFCGQCGAEIVVTTVHKPAPAAEAAPAPEVVPAVEAAPVAVDVPVKAPVSSLDAAPAPWKFPLVSVILMGIVFLMTLIPLFSQFGALTPGATGSLSASFGLSITEVCCLAVLIVGMIVCKKPRNLMVAITFLVMSMMRISGAALIISSYLSYGFDIATALGASLLNWVDCLCFILIGVAYLVARPKIAGLKIAACATAVGFGLLTKIVSVIVLKGDGAVALLSDFLLYTVALYAAALLYTPFRKKK